MTNTPLNPDGVDALAFHLFESEGGERKNWYDPNRKINKRYYREIAGEAARAYLAVAQPVVNTVDRVSEVLRKHQWDQAFGQCICGKVMPTIVNSEHCVYVPDDKRMAEHQTNVLHDPEVTL